MKRSKLCLLSVTILIICVLFSSCSKLISAFEDEKTRGYTDVVLEAIIDEDIDSAYSIFSDITTEDEFAPVFYEMKDLIKDVETYELKLLSINTNTNISDGMSITETRSVYEMTTNDGKYIVEAKMSNLAPKLSAFHIAPYEETDYYYTGTIGHMKDTGVLQWIFLLSNLIVIGTMVFALIDCCRRKVKLKALWIIIIIIGIGAFNVTFGPSQLIFNLNFGWLTAYNALIRYGGGSSTVRLMFPLGSIAYFALRSLIIKRDVPVQEPYFIPPQPYMPPNTPDPMPESVNKNIEE